MLQFQQHLFRRFLEKWRALSIQQKFPFEISEIPHAHWLHSGCIDPTQATAHLVNVLSSRVQKSGTGDNNFVKWKGTLQSVQPKRPDQSKRTTFKADPEYSGRFKLRWSVPFDVPTEISGILGWMESNRWHHLLIFNIWRLKGLTALDIKKRWRLRLILCFIVTGTCRHYCKKVGGHHFWKVTPLQSRHPWKVNIPGCTPLYSKLYYLN